MTITLNNTILCAGSNAGTPGDPTGPDSLDQRLQPGTEDYEYINAPGIDAQHIGCDRVSLSFSVTRTYPTVNAAQTAAITLKATTPRQGLLAIDGTTHIAQATLRDMDTRQIGCSLIIRYALEGF